MNSAHRPVVVWWVLIFRGYLCSRGYYYSACHVMLQLGAKIRTTKHTTSCVDSYLIENQSKIRFLPEKWKLNLWMTMDFEQNWKLAADYIANWVYRIEKFSLQQTPRWVSNVVTGTLLVFLCKSCALFEAYKTLKIECTFNFCWFFPFSFQVKWNNDVIQYGGGPLGAPDSMGMVVAERSEVVQS